MNDSSSTTVSKWLEHSIKSLSDAKVDSARLDALILLSDELGQDKSWVLAHPEYVLQIEQIKKLNTKIAHRIAHVPLAYIRGHAEFYGRDFRVNSHVLVPRPETEDAIDAVITATVDVHNPLIVDIGTGSGCIAITLALSINPSRIIGIDISDAALSVARDNAKRHSANVTFQSGDLLAPLGAQADEPLFIVANLPYVPLHFPINEAAKHEPSIALFSGDDGLADYRRLFEQLHDLSIATTVITESLELQHEALKIIAKTQGYKLVETKGLIQTFTKD